MPSLPRLRCTARFLRRFANPTLRIPRIRTGFQKYAIELDYKAAHAQFELNHVIFRAHNVHGERQNFGDRYRNVTGIFMNQVMSGQKMTVFGDGSQTSASSSIDDVALWIALSAERPDLSK